MDLPCGFAVVSCGYRVHTPEFPFGENVDNIRQAAKEMKIDYPITVDTSYVIWHAFKNEYWPRSISPMRKGTFDIINSAKANTHSRKSSFSNRWPRPVTAASLMIRFWSMPGMLKLSPIGTA
jgi:hypothetical protein